MKCQKCSKDKHQNNFYYIDGGLRYTQEYMNICKDCVKEYNTTKYPTKYYDEQISALYYAALSIINGATMSEVLKKLENGITQSSNRMGIQNFLYLFGKQGLSGVSKQKKKIFNHLYQKQ